MDLAEFAKKVREKDFNANDLCDFVCCTYGINDKKPFVVKESYYIGFKGIKIYRGLNCSPEVFNDYVEKFAFGDMFLVNRLSVLGQGFYFADKKFVASYYTNDAKLGLIKKPIISAKIMPDAKFITKNKLNVEFRNNIRKIKTEMLVKFDGLLTEDEVNNFVEMLNSFADPIVKGTILGYDGLISSYPNKRNGNIYLVFNRGKLLMSETEIQSVKTEIEPYIQFD